MLSTMKWIHYFNYILQVTCLMLVADCAVMETEKDVVEYIFSGYNPNIRPVKDFKKPINISIYSSLMKVERLNDLTQEFQSTFVINAAWVDGYLNWDVKQAGGISYVSIPARNIWTPHLTISNSAGDDISKEMSFKPYAATVFSSGQVNLSFLARLKTACSVNLSRFPFDNQTCTVGITTNVLNQYHRLLISPPPSLDNHSFLERNTEWKDIEFEQTVKTTELAYGMHIDSILITVKMNRNPTFYVLYLIIPAVFMAFVSLLVFLLPAESGERIGLSVTVLLSYSFFMLMVSDICPRDGENLSIIVIYITMMEGISVINLAVSVIILRFHHNKSVMLFYLNKSLCQVKCREKDKAEDENKVVPCQENAITIENEYCVEKETELKSSEIARKCNVGCFIISFAIVALTSLGTLLRMTSD